MGARTGEQFPEGLRKTRRIVWVGDERVDDVTTHPALAQAARTLAGIYDRQHRFPEECLVADPATGELVNVSHMIPRSVGDLQRRNRGLSRISEATVGLMGRTPDYMNVKFACFAARAPCRTLRRSLRRSMPGVWADAVPDKRQQVR